ERVELGPDLGQPLVEQVAHLLRDDPADARREEGVRLGAHREDDRAAHLALGRVGAAVGGGVAGAGGEKERGYGRREADAWGGGHGRGEVGRGRPNDGRRRQGASRRTTNGGRRAIRDAAAL